MNAQKTSETTAKTSSSSTDRKPWRKKGPIEVVLDQIDRVRTDVTKKEEELKTARRQLQKLEEAKKLLESA
jgi:polyhydroxyalkanoate synthesis regulator phasin